MPLGKTIDQLPEKTSSIVDADKLLVTDSVTGSSMHVTGDKLPAGVAANWKPSVRLASTANGVLATDFEIGDTLDDGVLVAGNWFFLKDQTTASENGIYTPSVSGAPVRVSDLDAGASAAGAAVIVKEGTANADTAWLCTTNEPNDIVGTDDLVFGAWPGGPGGAGDVSAAANIADNAIVRGDGGAKGVQTSGLSIDDSDNLTVPGILTGEGQIIAGTFAAAGFLTIYETSPAGEPVGAPNIARLFSFEAASGYTELYGRNSNGDIEQITGTEVVPNNHASRHERAGADEINGDHLDIDYTPSNYTPTTSPAEAAHVDDLAAHLGGVDNELLVKIAAAISAATATVNDGTYDNSMTECTNAAGCTVTIDAGRPAGTMLMFFASVAGQAVTLAAGAGGMTFDPLNGKTLVSLGQGHPVGVLFLTTTRCLRLGSFGV